MFLHTWIPHATFEMGGVILSWYGFFLALALVGAYILISVIARRSDRVSGTHFEEHIDGLFWWTFLPALVGARLLFVLYHPSHFLSAPQEIIALWHGGIVWHGALLGGIIGSAAYCRLKKIPWLRIADMAAPALAVGQAIGRWGNYFNQENYGLSTSLPWGIPIDIEHRLSDFEQFTYFHPAFLYESIGDMFLGVMVLMVLYRTVFLKMAPWYRSGTIFFAYLALYSAMRFTIEFLRIDSVPIWWGLRFPQWWSIDIFIVAGFFLFYFYIIKKPR